MDTVRTRMLQLAKKGYHCSQILIILGLEAKGVSNPDLVRAVGGLAGGCVEGSCTCGSLTGGCCLISLFAGKGSDHEETSENYQAMMVELVRWFWQTYGFNCSGIDCMAIREAVVPIPPEQRCWKIMEDVYEKVIELLSAHSINPWGKSCYAS